MLTFGHLAAGLGSYSLHLSQCRLDGRGAHIMSPDRKKSPDSRIAKSSRGEYRARLPVCRAEPNDQLSGKTGAFPAFGLDTGSHNSVHHRSAPLGLPKRGERMQSMPFSSFPVYMNGRYTDDSHAAACPCARLGVHA